jgi:hypothetical protein
VAAASLAGKNMSLDKKLAADLLSLLDRISDKAGLGLKIGIYKAQRDISKSNLPF